MCLVAARDDHTDICRMGPNGTQATIPVLGADLRIHQAGVGQTFPLGAYAGARLVFPRRLSGLWSTHQDEIRLAKAAANESRHQRPEGVVFVSSEGCLEIGGESVGY